MNEIYTYNRCPKCGKPYYYVGDILGDIKDYICTCRSDEETEPEYKIIYNANALDRIATALETLIRLLETGNARIRRN